MNIAKRLPNELGELQDMFITNFNKVQGLIKGKIVTCKVPNVKREQRLFNMMEKLESLDKATPAFANLYLKIKNFKTGFKNVRLRIQGWEYNKTEKKYLTLLTPVQ